MEQEWEQQHAMWAKQASEQAEGHQLSVSGDLGRVSCSSQYDTLGDRGKWREVSSDPTKGLLAVVCLVCLWKVCC